MKDNSFFKFILVIIALALVVNGVLTALALKGETPESAVQAVTVDIDAVFESSAKRKALQAEIDEKAAGYSAEIEKLKQQSVARAAELEAMRKAMVELEAGEEKTKQEESLVQGVQKLRGFEREVAKQAQIYKEQIAQDSAAAAATVLQEIYELVERKAEAQGYHQVINSEAQDKNGVPIMLYNYDQTDFTSTIIAELNQ